MASATVGNEGPTIRSAVRTHSGMFLAQGILLAVLGIAAIVWPQVSTLAADLFVGWLLLISGAVGLVMMFMAPRASDFFWSLLTGALALFAGVVLIWHPVEGAVSLTLLLVGFFIVEGLFQCAAAIALRSAFPESWGWLLISGVADLVLAALIIAGWPGSATWAIGLLVGVNLLSSGIAIAMVAMGVRRATG